jgi:DNA-directed RNA polymerase subunit M/transcription elongation factor TFIIS
MSASTKTKSVTKTATKPVTKTATKIVTPLVTKSKPVTKSKSKNVATVATVAKPTESNLETKVSMNVNSEQNFIMGNTKYLPENFIKISSNSIDRHSYVNKLDSLIKSVNLAKDIENGIFEFALNYVKTQDLSDEDFSSIYTDKFNELYDNLDQNNTCINNQTLLPSLNNGALSGQIIAFLKMYQLHPAKWKNIIDKNDLRDHTLYTVNTTDEYRCGRCGERKHTYYITQTRCADEPATVFYTCIVCKKTFTKSI